MRALMMIAAISGVVLAACGSQPPAATAQASIAVPTPTTLEAPATVAPSLRTAAPRFPAPTELIGRWRTVITQADRPILTIRELGYVIERFGIGSGPIEVHGDEIDFLASNLCAGVGRYRWSIDGGELHLKLIAADECPGRSEALNDKTFTRLG
jgi:hypothetical protein